MVRVIIERRVKKGENVWSLLRELRTAAVQQPGYITGETLVSAEDKSVIVVISTWRNFEDWKAWETSEARTRLYRQIEPLLVEKPRVRIFEIPAT
ncbi:MAG: antibiotic biosynthesis monooxygenase family protein [Dehalococcoidales bacterium]